jgi:DNA helicase II / ATP-dependent DNA helicase PcrA
MSKLTPQFLSALKNLNKNQRKAVETIEGPVMVVAGPGTGKTQILTLRIAQILAHTDTPPEAVLALTFTEAAAAHMRRRLVSIVGAVGYRVRISTFHGFCKSLIEQYPESFPRIIGGDVITPIQEVELFRHLIDTHELEYLKPSGDPYHHMKYIPRAISEFKREYLSPEKYTLFLNDQEQAVQSEPDLYHAKGRHIGTMKGEFKKRLEKIAKSRELAVLYTSYEVALRERGLYDFNDLIVEVISALRTNSTLLLTAQEECQYILADEHQDANESQNALLELLSGFHENPNLFVVGDEKQAVYRFQGASLENFMYFKKRFPEAVILHLEDVYRSGQNILDAAHVLINVDASGEEVAMRPQLQSKAESAHSLVSLNIFMTTEAERAWVARECLRLVGEGVDPTHIAVLYRNNREAFEVARALEAVSLTVSIESDLNALHDPVVRKLIAILKCVAKYGSTEELARALHIDFLNVHPLDVYKMIRYSMAEKLILADILGSDELLKKAGVVHKEHCLQLSEKLVNWARGGESVIDVVDSIVHTSGLLENVVGMYRSLEIIERLAGVMKDIEELASGNPDYSITDLVNHIQLLEEYGIPVRKETRAQPKAGSVRLMTVHKSKGLEFDYVFVVNVTDALWSGKNQKVHFIVPAKGVSGSDDDERRLLYVALTRAKHAVSVSYANANREGKLQQPSRLLAEVSSSHMQVTDMTDFSVPSLQPRTKTSSLPTLADKDFITTLFKEQGLSVTALNNYLECPWRYFYSNLIRIPIMPTVSSMMGTAAHDALTEFFNTRAHESAATLEILLQAFTYELRRKPMTETEIAVGLKDGIEMLTGWYQQWHPVFPTQTITEHSVMTELQLLGSVQTVRLRGELDRMDLHPEGVVVVDYKYKKAMSRNAIEGNTKADDDGNYYRQLVFYKLLLELEGRYTFAGATLDFLKPKDSGVYAKETFSIGDEQVIELKKEIQNMVEEIMDLSFWDKRCEDEKCKYCKLREHM